MLAANVVAFRNSESPLPELARLLKYESPLAIKRFKRNFPSLADDAENLFEDMLSYLWLCRHHELALEQEPNNPDLQFNCVMHKEMRDIDEMWHTFILITKEYHQFCENFFGGYMHHVPESGDEADEAAAIDINKFECELRLFLNYVYEHLGEKTIKRWFANYL